jgi:ubiquinone/menaquinone biosynthesis C-methylase UbiE
VSEHWNAVWTTRDAAEVSWFQTRADRSLQLIGALGPAAATAIVDVGGGASPLVDDLLAAGYGDITVVDIAAAALAQARARLGPRADQVTWVAADVRSWVPGRHVDIWHDRAVFHFLTDPADRAAYVATASTTLQPGGYAVVASFALDGPEQCSGLPVRRYDAPALAAEFGAGFELVCSETETHRTPWDAPQQFTYVVLRRAGATPAGRAR